MGWPTWRASPPPSSWSTADDLYPDYVRHVSPGSPTVFVLARTSVVMDAANGMAGLLAPTSLR